MIFGAATRRLYSTKQTPAIVGELKTRAAALKSRVVLPESTDPRVVEAAKQLVAEGLCKPVLVDNANVLDEGSIPGVEVIRNGDDERRLSTDRL